MRPTTAEIASYLRAIIEGQIARSGTGRAVAALVDDAEVMGRFVTNIVGNLTMAVDGWIDDGIVEDSSCKVDHESEACVECGTVPESTIAAASLLLANVSDLDVFIDDPAHTSHEIENMVRDGKSSGQIATIVRGWIRNAVTSRKGETYEVSNEALARFVKREIAVANARIKCDREDAA